MGRDRRIEVQTRRFLPLDAACCQPAAAAAQQLPLLLRLLSSCRCWGGCSAAAASPFPALVTAYTPRPPPPLPLPPLLPLPLSSPAPTCRPRQLHQLLKHLLRNTCPVVEMGPQDPGNSTGFQTQGAKVVWWGCSVAGWSGRLQGSCMQVNCAAGMEERLVFEVGYAFISFRCTRVVVQAPMTWEKRCALSKAASSAAPRSDALCAEGVVVRPNAQPPS